MISRVVLMMIGAYQSYLSPRKGFSCAYRVAHGGPGCSGYAKATIATNGVFAAWPDIRRRFDACKQVAQQMRDSDPEKDDTNTPNRRKKGGWFIADCLTGCGPSPCGRSTNTKSDGCDATPDCAPDCCSF